MTLSVQTHNHKPIPYTALLSFFQKQTNKQEKKYQNTKKQEQIIIKKKKYQKKKKKKKSTNSNQQTQNFSQIMFLVHSIVTCHPNKNNKK